MSNIYKFDMENKNLKVNDGETEVSLTDEFGDLPDGLKEIVENGNYLSAFIDPRTGKIFMQTEGNLSESEEILAIIALVSAMATEKYAKNPRLLQEMKRKMKNIINNENFWESAKKDIKNIEK